MEEDGDALTADITLKKNGRSAKKIVFTNYYEEIDLDEQVTISGRKTWEHGENPRENWPDDIIVKVFADGRLTRQRRVTAETDWEYSFTLPRYTEDGEEILYTVDEEDVPDYSKKITGYDITNTYVGTGAPEQPTEPTEPDTEKPVVPIKPPKTGDEFPP